MKKQFVTLLQIFLLTWPAFGVEQLEMLQPPESDKCVSCDQFESNRNYNKLVRNLLSKDDEIIEDSAYFEMQKTTFGKEIPKRFMGGDNLCNTILPNGHIIIKDC